MEYEKIKGALSAWYLAISGVLDGCCPTFSTNKEDMSDLVQHYGKHITDEHHIEIVRKWFKFDQVVGCIRELKNKESDENG